MGTSTSFQAGTSSVVPIRVRDERLELLDQRQVPDAIEYFDATGLDEMCFAIKSMIVRGAPAIGAAAALGLAFEARRLVRSTAGREEFFERLAHARDQLQATRPTAVNLSWDTDLVFRFADKERLSAEPLESLTVKMVDYAEWILARYGETCKQIGEYGADLVGQTASILTHCNAGALAACGWGTALGVIRSAHQRGCKLAVYVDETRPRQQGSRLTTWELLADGITPTLVTDSMAGHLMANRMVDLVVVGADRIALNGDAANKIGTYTLAVVARAHAVPFYVAAPLSTIDPAIGSGSLIPIEEREGSEVTIINGREICPPGVQVYNPAFDVTPASMISAIITETGVLKPPFESSIQAALKSRKLTP